MYTNRLYPDRLSTTGYMLLIVPIGYKLIIFVFASSFTILHDSNSNDTYDHGYH